MNVETNRPILPVATSSDIRDYLRMLAKRFPWRFLGVLGLQASAVATALIPPRLLGAIAQDLTDHRATPEQVTWFALAIAGLAMAQALLLAFAARASAVLGELVLAELRENFVRSVLLLPLSTVERAGNGDLTTRTTRDVDAMVKSIRSAVPEVLIAMVTAGMLVVATVVNGPLLALPILIVIPTLLWAGRWYLRRAGDAYLAENASWGELAEGISQSADGARTVEMFDLARQRVHQTDDDLRRAWRAEKATLRLRTFFFPQVDGSFVILLGATLGLGGLFVLHGWATIGSLVAATVYAQMLSHQLGQLLSYVDELQVAAGSLARLLGVAQVRPDREARPATVQDERVVATSLRYSYDSSVEVLRGIDLELHPGQSLAIVGPSGAGKSTLARLLAGIHPPSGGSVTVGGVPLVELPLGDLRGHVALLTQEHHVFMGTLRENVVLADPAATDARVRDALMAVDAWRWVEQLPAGLDTMVGSGQHRITAAQAQQVALARLIVADPHTLVLDEATSMLDPTSVRNLERSLKALLDGRTVVSVAHRLQVSRDADRIAVVRDGLIVELGSHQELLEAGRESAELWKSWQGSDKAS
ncbi:ABC transporter ATP-binding protein [Micromonospora sp. MP36]|uniref:ABC transporter ATP-binding protein n=1 Tax=Micromonospora sp. MP36 TaxID=2604468 RepID=UPI00210481DD|nr:ABC transporter ATP-binding protein [Micromonospora sp. MP36]